MSSLRVVVVAIVSTVALAACGGITRSTGPEPAPGGIDTVEWPQSTERAKAVLDGLPEEFAGLDKNAIQTDEEFQSVSVDYGEQPAGAAVLIELKREWQTPAESFFGLYSWLGCVPSDTDFRATANVTELLRQAYTATAMPTLELEDAGPTWVECTSKIGVDSGTSLPPEYQAHNLLWKVGEWTYWVSARTAADRDALLKDLVAAAS